MMKRTSKLLFTVLITLPLLLHTQENRSLDGTENNIDNPVWGSAFSTLAYHIGQAFEDGISIPNGATRPDARLVSNTIFDQPAFIESNLEISDFGWGFGQFIDHDITFVNDNPAELITIPIPECDAFFDPGCSGTEKIEIKRSVSDPLSGTGVENPRKVINEITAFVDGSAVYGTDQARSDWLRTFNGGKLKTSLGNLLPYNTTDGEFGSPVDPGAPFMILEGIPPARHFIAGDVRANEQPGLSSFHTLFVREHNRLCDELAIEHPDWSDEELFQRARKWVGAYIQAILYQEFLPALGVVLEPYEGYDDNLNPSIINVFSAAAYRLGHTLVNDQIVRLNEDGETFEFGSIDLKTAFFNPDIIRNEGGIEPIFTGMATQMQQTFDIKVVPALRNFLFGPPGSGGLDLVSINIQRGRERGLPDYNSIRDLMGLVKHTTWSDITADIDLQILLENTYTSIDDIDPWVGMLSEDIMPGKATGELVMAVLEEQFRRLRDGDRYYFENDPAFTAQEIETIQGSLFSDIIKRNTGIQNIQDDVFHAEPLVLTAVEILPFPGIKTIEISAYPNPVHRNMNLVISSQENQLLTLRLLDASGKLFLEEPMNITIGMNHFEFSLDSRYTSGVYIVQINSDSGTGSLQLIKR